MSLPSRHCFIGQHRPRLNSLPPNSKVVVKKVATRKETPSEFTHVEIKFESKQTKQEPSTHSNRSNEALFSMKEIEVLKDEINKGSDIMRIQELENKVQHLELQLSRNEMFFKAELKEQQKYFAGNLIAVKNELENIRACLLVGDCGNALNVVDFMLERLENFDVYKDMGTSCFDKPF